MRWMTAVAVEVVVVVLGLLVAVWSWRMGLVETVFPASGRVPEYTATRYVGSWILFAAALVLVAGLVALDAVARVVRAVRGR